MHIKKIISWSILLLSIAILNGCASNEPPEWFDQSINDTDSDYMVVSHGFSKYDAEQKGLMQITQKLSTKIDSTVKTRDAGVSVNLDGEESLRSFGYTDISINSTSARLPLNGIQVVNSLENDSGYYVKMKISKASIRKQMQNELQQYEEQAQAQLTALQHQDRLEWWVKNRDIRQFLSDVKTRISILASVNPSQTYRAPITLRYADTVAKIKSAILIYVSSNQEDSQKAIYLADFLAKEELGTTKNHGVATHTIELASTYATNRIGKYYRYTVNSNLSVTNNRSQRVIASNSLVSVGSSPNSLRMAKVGSSQDFSQQITEKGLWKSLGFSEK